LNEPIARYHPSFAETREIALPFSLVAAGIIVFFLAFSRHVLAVEFAVPIIVLAGFAIISANYRKIGPLFLRLTWPLFCVALIGGLGALLTEDSSFQMRDLYRDLAFALVPIALLGTGIWLATIETLVLIRVLMSAAFALAVFHLSQFALIPELLDASLEDVRNVPGSSDNLVALALIIGLVRFTSHRMIFPSYFPRLVVLGVLTASLALSYSRAQLSVLAVMTLTLCGASSRFAFRPFIIVGALGVLLAPILVLVSVDGGGDFLTKIADSLSEMAPLDYANKEDISAKWRGYETYVVWADFLSANIAYQILGKGFGAVVDLGFYMPLNGEDFRYLPVFHNGYAYILLKTGLAGISLYVLFYLHLIRISRSGTRVFSREIGFNSYLLAGCACSLALTMFAIGGIAQGVDPAIALLVGYLVGQIKLQLPLKSWQQYRSRGLVRDSGVRAVRSDGATAPTTSSD